MALRLSEEVSAQEDDLSLSSPPSLEPDWTLISPQGVFSYHSYVCIGSFPKGGRLELGYPTVKCFYGSFG